MPLKLELGSRLASVIRISRFSGIQYRFQSSISTIPSQNRHSDKLNSDSCKQKVTRLETVTGNISLDSFRKTAWISETPLLLRASQSFPAIQKWFQYGNNTSQTSFSQYMKTFEDIVLPYELTMAHSSQTSNEGSEHNVLLGLLRWLRESQEYKDSYLPVVVEGIIQPFTGKQTPDDSPLTFQQFNAPLRLIMSACQFNETKVEPMERIRNLYIAQSDLSFLPEPLTQDLPVPDIVKHAGKGDIYSSSIWLGLQPTYTPLHRDPNPNLFCQLVGSKRIRLMTPNQGDGVYARVRRELGFHGNSRFRGAEMMGGRERDLLHQAVWDNTSVDEVLLDSGDALFIPKGWWHSVASSGKEGGLNASVNWWFR
ncbi:Clavaminate synthase-like protein [Hypoxylon sp. FL0890]|nr:Clavaminate synthase-like protein [Hypoxylon sp. FL0890]